METKEKKRTGQPKRPRSEQNTGSKPSQANKQGQKISREEAKRRAKEREAAKLKAESQERAKRRAAKKEQERAQRQAAERARAQRIQDGRRRSAERIERRQQEKKHKRTPRREAPQVVYTAPKAFNSAGFLLRLAAVVAVVIALTFSISIFFKVDTVNVSGTEKYTPWMVLEASGIKKGDNLLAVPKARASGRITAALPYIGSVRIEIRLPDTVNIEVTELDVVYSVQDSQNQWWLMTAEGRLVEKVSEIDAGTYTRILGVQLDSPAAGKQAVAFENQEDETVRGSDRLEAALTILRNLELNGMIGGIDSVNVENTGSLELWYGNQYQVKLGDTSRLDYKISCLYAAVNQMDDFRSGVLDISFTIWPDQPGYTPFNES